MDLVLDGGFFGWFFWLFGCGFLSSFKYNLMKEEIDQCSLKAVAPYARFSNSDICRSFCELGLTVA